MCVWGGGGGFPVIWNYPITLYVDCIIWPLCNNKLETERREEEQLGEATARCLEEEEHEQVKYDEEMAEVLSQDFILKQIVSIYMLCNVHLYKVDNL